MGILDWRTDHRHLVPALMQQRRANTLVGGAAALLVGVPSFFAYMSEREETKQARAEYAEVVDTERPTDDDRAKRLLRRNAKLKADLAACKRR